MPPRTPAERASLAMQQHGEITAEQHAAFHEHRGRHRALAEVPRESLLDESRIPLTAHEHAAVEALIASHGSSPGLTRRDTGETGPVVASFGEDVYEIGEGQVTKVG